MYRRIVVTSGYWVFLVQLRKSKQWRSWLEAFFKVYLDHKESSLLFTERKLGWFHTWSHSLWMPVATPGRGPTIREWRHQTVYQKYKKSKAARQDISVKEIDVPFIQPYSMFSLDILCLLQGFKMNHNNLFLHTKPGTHLYLPGQALCLHEGKRPSTESAYCRGSFPS